MKQVLLNLLKTKTKKREKIMKKPSLAGPRHSHLANSSSSSTAHSVQQQQSSPKKQSISSQPTANQNQNSDQNHLLEQSVNNNNINNKTNAHALDSSRPNSSSTSSLINGNSANKNSAPSAAGSRRNSFIRDRIQHAQTHPNADDVGVEIVVENPINSTITLNNVVSGVAGENSDASILDKHDHLSKIVQSVLKGQQQEQEQQENSQNGDDDDEDYFFMKQASEISGILLSSSSSEPASCIDNVIDLFSLQNNNSNNNNSKNNETGLKLNAILSDKHQQNNKNVNTKASPTINTSKQSPAVVVKSKSTPSHKQLPSSTPAPLSSKQATTKNSTITTSANAEWNISLLDSCSTSSSPTALISGSNLSLPKQKRSIDVQVHVSGDNNSISQKNQKQSSRQIVLLKSLCLDSKEVGLPAALAAAARKAKTKNQNQNNNNSEVVDDDDQKPQNEWQRRAQEIQDGSATPFALQQQNKGWICAQICGRTCPSSVTCLVIKNENDNNNHNNDLHFPGLELRHVGGSITSVSSSSTSKSLMLSLSSSAISDFNISWNPQIQNQKTIFPKNSKSYPSYLIPSSCELEGKIEVSSKNNNNNSKNSIGSLIFEGTLKFGARHSFSTTKQKMRSKLGISVASTSSSTTSNNNNSSSFNKIEYFGNWTRDVFSGSGTLIAKWIADQTGAGSGGVVISSKNWKNLASPFSSSSSSSSSCALSSKKKTIEEENSNNLLMSIKLDENENENENEIHDEISSRDPCAIHFLPPSTTSASNILQFICEGKMLNNSNQNQQQSQDSAKNLKKCLHVFKSSNLPVLSVFVPKNENGASSAVSDESRTSMVLFSQQNLKNGEVIICREGEEDENDADDACERQREEDKTTTSTTTLGAVLAMRKNSSTPNSSSPTAKNYSSYTTATPNSLLLSLANADLVQLLFAKVSENKKNSQNENDDDDLLQQTTRLEASLVKNTCEWNIFSEMCRIARENFIEPKKSEVDKMQSNFETTTKKKFEATRKTKQDLTEKVKLTQEGLDLLLLNSSSSSSANITNNNNQPNSVNTLEQMEENIEQANVDIESAKVSVQEQNEHLLQLKEEIRQSDARVRHLNEDVDALERENDHCSETKRSLTKKKADLEQDKQKQNAAYAAAKKKLQELEKEMKSLQIEYFVRVMEPEERRKVILISSEKNDSSSPLEALTFLKAPRFIEDLTSSYEKKRILTIESISKIKSQIEKTIDEKEKMQKTLREIPDESSLLVAFQSAEAQSEIILSRIRAMQSEHNNITSASSSINTVVANVANSENSLNNNISNLPTETSLRAKHAATMSNFSKRITEIRESIRSQTDREAAIVAEMEKIQKEHANLLSSSGGGVGGGERNLRIRATAPVAEEFFSTTNKINNNNNNGNNAETPSSIGEQQELEEEKLLNKAKKDLQQIKSESKTVLSELREVKYCLKTSSPSLMLLDSSQLASCSNDLLRKLLNDAKNPSINTNMIMSSNDVSGNNLMKSPSIISSNEQQQQQTQNQFSVNNNNNKNNNGNNNSVSRWSLSDAMRDFESKNKALQNAISHCDSQISELRIQAQRVKLLESKLAVAIDAASVAATSSQLFSGNNNCNNSSGLYSNQRHASYPTLTSGLSNNNNKNFPGPPNNSQPHQQFASSSNNLLPALRR